MAGLCAVGLGACAGGAQAGRETRALTGQGGADDGRYCIVAREPLTVGPGIFAYIEPEDLIRLETAFVVVGTPSYTWAPGTDADSLPLTRDQHLAARFTLDGRASLIDKPIVSDIGSVRALSLGGDRWGALFDVVRENPLSEVLHTVELWYAEHEGERWSLVERVPIPEGVELDFHSSSELVRVGPDLTWVVAARLPSGLSELVQYRYAERRWQHGVVSDDWVETSAMAYDRSAGLWLAHFSGNPGVPKSLKVYRWGVSWELVRQWFSPPGVLVLDPSVTISPGGVSVSWRIESRADMAAYALLDVDRSADGTPVELDDYALQVMPLRVPGEGPRWVVTHLGDTGSDLELRILEGRPELAAGRLLAEPSPYLAFLASLALSRDEALIVGPEVSSDPADPFVRSLVLRLSTSCS